MTSHRLKWFIPDRKIVVNDKMQEGYTYTLKAKCGRKFDENFEPYLTPGEMLSLGVFEGKYLNDCRNEFPEEWFDDADAKDKLCPDEADKSVNMFKIKSRQSLQIWIDNGWIPVCDGDKDVRGWFQWYCRYYIGRRIPNVDKKQISRWKSFARHRGQILASLRKMDKKDRPTTKSEIMKHRPKQRQALLQWAYDPLVVL